MFTGSRGKGTLTLSLGPTLYVLVGKTLPGEGGWRWVMGLVSESHTPTYTRRMQSIGGGGVMVIMDGSY